MPTLNRFNIFAQDLGRKVHNLHSDVLKVALSNTAPAVTNVNISDSSIVQITAEHGYAAGGQTVPTNTYTQTGGIAKLTSADVVITASGGNIGPFRYAILYNSTAGGALIGWWDYGSSLGLASGEKYTIHPSAVDGLWKLTI
jgi:hypothetical protein